MLSEKRSYIYQYRGVYTQTDAGGGDIDVWFGKDEAFEFELIRLTLGPNNYGAGRTAQIYIRDEDNAISTRLISKSIDNEYVVYPNPTSDVTDNHHTDVFFFGPTDFLAIELGSAAQNETLTISLEIRTRNMVKPVRTTSTSGGTVSETSTTIDRFIG